MANIRVPPHSLEAEASVLGSLLIDKEAIAEIAGFLRPEHFYKDSHSRIYKAMLSLYEEREPIDLVTVSDKLKKDKSLTKVGGANYLSELANKVPTAAHVEHYAKLVKDEYTKRELISTAGNITEMAFDEGKDISEILDTAERNIFGLSQQHLQRVFIAIKDALAESFDRLDELHKSAGGLRGVPTGFTDLDNSLAGMQPSNLLILAGRPGLGKTALALNIAQYASVEQKIPVGFFSLEMSREELVDRLLVAQANIDAWKLKTGRLGEEEFTSLSEAMGVLADAPLFIDDTPAVSVSEMRTKARRLMAEQGLKLIVVDYLQLVRGRNLENRVQEVTEISQGLKNLARELKVPVLALSQLSRAVEHRGTKQPQLADLRESGAIEQDADVVMFLYREDEDDLENMKLIIAKHRNGPLRTINVRFVGERIRFYGVERKRETRAVAVS
ncbi:replicative DNA helicase [Microgenomates group bacterium RIFCSPLOWO2_01_FULL_46_13]|nr:MAG: replicative DNA helicase [Microgenomates group bacterium RIFCSPHIGHO2_01_FULL_45_11]OGV94831.1 MAG: replicative DNA helicase [Microgenomates group bacterium RIFCSPLOWO2_01_FULL_46_13]